MKMADQRRGVIMNVLAGRMGTKQPLIRPILAITKDGGWKPQNGDTAMPDPKLEKQIARTGHLILVFHVGDWIAPTDDLVWDLGMMGDGAVDIPRIRTCIENAGYRCFNEVEIFSKRDWWKRDPLEVVDTCIDRYQHLV